MQDEIQLRKNKYDVNEFFNENLQHPYEIMLELPQVNHLYVGYYYCVRKSSTHNSNLEALVNSGKASNIYLFVEGRPFNFSSIEFRFRLTYFCITDPENPLVAVEIPMVQGNLYGHVNVPCKPTSKKVEVQLIKDGDEVDIFAVSPLLACPIFSSIFQCTSYCCGFVFSLVKSLIVCRNINSKQNSVQPMVINSKLMRLQTQEFLHVMQNSIQRRNTMFTFT